MQTYTLPRQGQRPLQFTGTLLAAAEGQDYSREPTRWYDLAAYQTRAGRYVVAWHYHTRWEGEQGHSSACDMTSLEAIASALENFDPCEWVMAYKSLLARHAQRHPEAAAPHYQQRQEQVERAIRTAYQAQVRDLLSRLGVAEHID